MKASSDHLVFVDESGDHSLTSINPDFPLFVLAFCIVRKSDYAQTVVPALLHLKHRWFGHELIVLHEKEIVRKENAFSFLQNSSRRGEFMADLDAFMTMAPITIIATVIRKDRLEQRYREPMNPYHLALLFCLERTRHFLDGVGDGVETTHVIAEARSPRAGSMGREDGDLHRTFVDIVEGRHLLQGLGQALPNFQLHFASKQANVAGLQLADLVARPLGLSVLRPGQQNRAFEIIRTKLHCREQPANRHLGLKVFP